MSATSRRATKVGGKKSSGKSRTDETDLQNLMERLKKLSGDAAEVNTNAEAHSQAPGSSSSATADAKVSSESSVLSTAAGTAATMAAPISQQPTVDSKASSKVSSEVKPTSSICSDSQTTRSISSYLCRAISTISSDSRPARSTAADENTCGKECSDAWEVASNASSDVCCAPRARRRVVEKAANAKKVRSKAMESTSSFPLWGLEFGGLEFENSDSSSNTKVRSDAWEVSSSASSDVCCAPRTKVRSDAWEVASSASSDVCCAPRAGSWVVEKAANGKKVLSLRSQARESAFSLPFWDVESESSDSSSSMSSSGLTSPRSASPIPSFSTSSASSSDSEPDVEGNEAIAINCTSSVEASEEAKIGSSPSVTSAEVPPIQHIYPISCSWPLFDINECSKEVEEEIAQIGSGYAPKSIASSDANKSFFLDLKHMEPEPEEQMDTPEFRASNATGKHPGIKNNLMNQEFEHHKWEAEDLRVDLARASSTLEKANDLMAKMSGEKDALAMWWEEGPPLSPTVSDDLDQWFQEEKQC